MATRNNSSKKLRKKRKKSGKSFMMIAKKKQSVNISKKKRIQDLKTPQLLIKVNYKGKKLSIPVGTIDQKNLSQMIMPFITRFEHEILKNNQFQPNIIENWKTINPEDPLKDYYFQTNQSIKLFHGQVIEIEPILKKAKVNKLKISDFQIIRCIGTGGFSRVYLAKYYQTGKFYALKLMEKQGLVESGKELIVLNERDILVQVDNPHILTIQFAFETKHFVVLALEYCPGGQLFYYLRKVKRMTEDQARYCFMEILLGIQYLHSKNIIYRDIKPENIMINANGDLKIADFGLSRQDIHGSELTYTFCGSPEYMSPEMLSKSGHTFSVDYYGLGALLYELVIGSPPFYSRDVEKIYYSIQNQEVQFPSQIQLSEEIKMLLEGLLKKDPKRRLGSLGGIREIMGHPWVRKLKPNDLRNQNLQSPIKVDLMNFNVNDDDIEEDLNFNDKLLDRDNNFEEIFDAFYYNKNDKASLIDEGLPSATSESTKENHNLNSKFSHQEKEKRNYKSQSRQKGNRYGLTFKTDSHTKGQSQMRTIKEKIDLKRGKSKKQLNLIERSRKRNERSLLKRKSREGKKLRNVKEKQKGKTLKRIKSTEGLQKKSIMFHNQGDKL